MREWRRQLQMWEFSSQAEKTPEQVATTVTKYGIDCVIWKSHQELNFLGNNYDRPYGARNVAEAIALTERFRAAGVEAYPWCVPTGNQMDAEVETAIALANGCGALGINLEEGWAQFWNRTPADFLTYISRVRAGAPNALLTVCFDCVNRAYDTMLVSQWAPFVDQLQPEVYPVDFGWTMTRALDHAWELLSADGCADKFVPCLGLNSGADVLVSEAGPWLVAHGISRVSAYVLHTSTIATQTALGTMPLADPTPKPAPDAALTPLLRDLLNTASRNPAGYANEVDTFVARVDALVAEWPEARARFATIAQELRGLSASAATELEGTK